METEGALERFKLMPPEFVVQHQFCFFLHDLMVRVLAGSESKRVADVHIRFRDEADRNKYIAADDPISFCLETGREEIAKQIVLNQVVIPLFSDILHFIYEALKALEKRKFTVALALLRKPLKYDLLLATWLFADPDDFYERLRKSPADHLEVGGISPKRRIELIDAALSQLDNRAMYSGELIHDLVFNRNNVRGLAIYFDKAAHPVTSYGKQMRTESLNLNFIFKSPADNDVYENTYFALAHLISYLAFLQIGLLKKVASVIPAYVSWMTMVTVGTFEALFVSESTSAVDAINNTFSEFLKCAACRKSIAITNETAPAFYMDETVHCGNCGEEQTFPLFWLTNVAAELKVKVEPDLLT